MENSKLTSILCVVSSVITLCVLLFINVGSGLFFEYSIVSLIAIICWLKFSFKATSNQTNPLSLYILGITLLVLLNTIRYASKFLNFLQVNYQHLFTIGFTINYIHWFVWMVCLPVSLLLFGGYFLSKRHTVGFFFAWWGFIYSVAESIIQFEMELGHSTSYKHIYFLGVIIAMVLFYLSVMGILRLIKPVPKFTQDEKINLLSKKKKNLWSLLIFTFVIIYATTVYIQAGLLPVGIVVGSMMGGLIAWRKTTSNFPADPYKLVPLYLLLLALFYVHMGEETLTHFNQCISSLTGHSWPDIDFNFTFALVGPILWIFAAYSLWKRQALGNYILWFMIIGMILGEPTHYLAFPVIRMFEQRVGYEYFSGMYTALFPMIPAILALVTILKDNKRRIRDTKNV